MLYEPNYTLLLPRLRNAAGSNANLALRLDITDKTLADWLSKAQNGELHLKPEQRDTVIRVTKELHLDPNLFADGPALWNPSEGYMENIARQPSSPPDFSFLDAGRKRQFLGFELNSPFGASASVLTSTSSRVRFLAHTGADILTYKTVRSDKYKAHRMPNILLCAQDVPTIDPDRPPSHVLVDDSFNTSSPQNGMMNRFGMPSPVAAVWQEDFRVAMKSMLPGQLLILSVVGTAAADAAPGVLVKDFVRVTELALEAGARVIEINGSCPNCSGMEGTLCHNLGVLVDVVHAVRQAAPEAKLLLKIGYLRPRELKTLVYETEGKLDGYTAINTFPIEGKRPKNPGEEPEPAFGQPKLKAGLSGAPIQQFAMRTIRELRRIRDANESMTYRIIGVGGVTKPSDVSLYLEAGADVVQATTAFFGDSLFAAKVRYHLAQEEEARAKNEKLQDKKLVNNILLALHELQDDFSENPAVTQQLNQTAIRVFADAQKDRLALLASGQYRMLAGIGTVEDFKRRLKAALMLP